MEGKSKAQSTGSRRSEAGEEEGYVTYRITKIGEEKLDPPVKMPKYGVTIECGVIRKYLVELLAVIEDDEHSLGNWIITKYGDCRIVCGEKRKNRLVM